MSYLAAAGIAAAKSTHVRSFSLTASSMLSHTLTAVCDRAWHTYCRTSPSCHQPLSRLTPIQRPASEVQEILWNVTRCLVSKAGFLKDNCVRQWLGDRNFGSVMTASTALPGRSTFFPKASVHSGYICLQVRFKADRFRDRHSLPTKHMRIGLSSSMMYEGGTP